MNGSRSHIIFIFGFTYTYFHLIQITGNIHSSLKRQRRFQNGYMIFKIHIQSLLSPYSSFITIYRHLKWINKNTTVINEGGNLAASKIRNLECPNYEICLIDYGCGKFNRKIHIMEQYP